MIIPQPLFTIIETGRYKLINKISIPFYIFIFIYVRLKISKFRHDTTTLVISVTPL